jgi:arginyl-tRNA synthetase
MKIVWIGQSLLSRYRSLSTNLFELFSDDDDIPAQAALLNKAWEDRDPDSVAIFPKMVFNTLTGHQATLDTYGVCHDRFDFESELSWKCLSGALISLLSRSRYVHPQTQRNAEGVPEGAYIDLDAYLADIGAKRWNGGYCSPFRPFYVLRPDGTRLYTLWDVAYSMKKVSEADMILNVICTEQNLTQEKVMLSLKALDPRAAAVPHGV